MPVISLRIQCVIMAFVLLLPSASSAIDDSASTLIRFLEKEHTSFPPLLPGYFTIADDFKPGITPSAGFVLQVQGEAYVHHQGEASVYKLKKDLPVFTGDTLVTDEKSRLTLQMPDNSILVLAAQTKLTIDRAMLRMNIRDTALQLFFGRVRALVKKLTGRYTIRTPTVFLGVRGTDFAMAVAPDPFNRKPTAELLTAVVTGGEDSTVALTDLSGSSMTVEQLSVVGIRTKSRAGEAMYVGSAAEDLLRRIAPLPALQSDLSPKAVPAHRPCWPLSGRIKPVHLEFFRACE